jgi:hypothetical protein
VVVALVVVAVVPVVGVVAVGAVLVAVVVAIGVGVVPSLPLPPLLLWSAAEVEGGIVHGGWGRTRRPLQVQRDAIHCRRGRRCCSSPPWRRSAAPGSHHRHRRHAVVFVCLCVQCFFQLLCVFGWTVYSLPNTTTVIVLCLFSEPKRTVNFFSVQLLESRSRQ